LKVFRTITHVHSVLFLHVLHLCGSTKLHTQITRGEILFYELLRSLQLGCASLLMSTLFSLGGLLAHLQNPHSWRTSLSVLVWPLSRLETSGIQEMRFKYKQNWINHLARMDNTRLPKQALNYKPRGRRESGRPRKRWQCVDTGTGQTT